MNKFAGDDVSFFVTPPIIREFKFPKTVPIKRCFQLAASTFIIEYAPPSSLAETYRVRLITPLFTWHFRAGVGNKVL